MEITFKIPKWLMGTLENVAEQRGKSVPNQIRRDLKALYSSNPKHRVDGIPPLVKENVSYHKAGSGLDANSSIELLNTD